MVDHLRVDDLIKGGDITLLYKRCVETLYDLFVLPELGRGGRAAAGGVACFAKKG